MKNEFNFDGYSETELAKLGFETLQRRGPVAVFTDIRERIAETAVRFDKAVMEKRSQPGWTVEQEKEALEMINTFTRNFCYYTRLIEAGKEYEEISETGNRTVN